MIFKRGGGRTNNLRQGLLGDKKLFQEKLVGRGETVRCRVDLEKGRDDDEGWLTNCRLVSINKQTVIKR